MTVMKASVNLATLYRSGDGVPRSLAKALTLYEEAAESRFTHAESKKAAKQVGLQADNHFTSQILTGDFRKRHTRPRPYQFTISQSDRPTVSPFHRTR